MALGRGPDALDAQGRDIDRRGEPRRCVVDHLVETELAARPFLVDVTSGIAGGLADPLVGLVEVVQAEVVVDRLGGEDDGQVLAQGLHPVERAVAADADQAVDLEPLEAVGHARDRLDVVAVDIVARGAQDRPPLRRIELGNAAGRAG